MEREKMKNIMNEIAILLGVEPLEEFTINVSKYGTILGYQVNKETIYRIDSELVKIGYDVGWSKWYGVDKEIFYGLCIGIYEVVKI